MTKLKRTEKTTEIAEVVECSNSKLYAVSIENMRGYHCSSPKNIGKKCAFCNGTYHLVKYSVPTQHLKREVIK